MIKVDYRIKRNEGDEVKTYSPKLIPSELPNVVYIKGPNSSGKSTLLNIIALAFFGLKLSDDELNQELRKKLNDLMDSDHQDIKFNITVENEKIGVKFESAKKDFKLPGIVVKTIRDGKASPISSDNFKRQYKLIYDIPTNPLDRMNELLNSIREEQKDVSNYLERNRNYLRQIIEDIKASKDPERINKLKLEGEKHLTSLGTESNKTDDLSHKLKDFTKYFLSKSYLEAKSRHDDISDQYEKLDKNIKKQKRNKSRESKKFRERDDTLINLKEEIDAVKEGIIEILPNLIEGDKGQLAHYKIWNEADIWEEISHPKIYKDLCRETDHFIQLLESKLLLEEQESRNDLEKTELLKLLIGLLTDFKDSNITVPVVNLPVSEFISNLEEDLNQFKDVLIKLTNIKDCMKSLELLNLLVAEGISIYTEISNNESEENIGNIDDWKREKERDDLKEKLKVWAEKIEVISRKIIKNDLHVNDMPKLRQEYKKNPNKQIYEMYTEAQLTEKIEDINKQFLSSQEKCKSLSNAIDNISQEINRLESKEPHKYQDKYDSIRAALAKVQGLETLFVGFDKQISDLIKDKYKKKSDKANNDYYADKIGKYLGKKIREIRHIDGVYKVRSIDIVGKKVKTRGGKIIHFTDLGTGQGQAAYLTTLLSMSENKKIIALFDEVAMMDEATLEPIKDKLKNLYEEKKLLLGIIVQKGNEVKVESLT